MPLNKIANNESGVISKNHNKNNLFQSLGRTTVCSSRHGALDFFLLYHWNLGEHPCSLTTVRFFCNSARNMGTFPFCSPLYFICDHANWQTLVELEGRTRKPGRSGTASSNGELSIHRGGGEQPEGKYSISFTSSHTVQTQAILWKRKFPWAFQQS